MSLSHEEVVHIAHLARLALSQEELARYREQLSSILDHVAKLQVLDTEDIEPMASILIAQSRLRDDTPGACLTEQELLSNAPASEADQFRVPPVLDQESA